MFTLIRKFANFPFWEGWVPSEISAKKLFWSIGMKPEMPKSGTKYPKRQWNRNFPCERPNGNTGLPFHFGFVSAKCFDRSQQIEAHFAFKSFLSANEFCFLFFCFTIRILLNKTLQLLTLFTILTQLLTPLTLTMQLLTLQLF